MSEFIIGCLQYLILPLWLFMGLADWYCHRRALIESTSGLRESIMHVVMLLEMGLPALAVLFLEVNTAVLLLCYVAFLIHEITAWADVRYASSARYVSPTEQMVHSFLEMIPLIGIFLLSSLHADQIAYLLKASFPRFTLDGMFHLKESPLSPVYLTWVVLGVLVFQVIPYSEEIWRCSRSRKYEPSSET